MLTVEEIQNRIRALCLCDRMDQIMLDAREVYEAVGLPTAEIDEQFPWTSDDEDEDEEE